MDSIEQFAQQRRQQMEAAAAVDRIGRECPPASVRPSWAMRVYARWWWASRPRRPAATSAAL